MMHYSDDQFAMWRRNQLQAEEHSAMQSHLSDCEECRRMLTIYEEMDEAFRLQEVWDSVALFLDRRPPRLAALMAEYKRIEHENEEAAKKLKPYLKSPMHFMDADFAGDPRLHDAGVARMLVAQAASRHEKSPKFALQLAAAACTIARKVPAQPLLLGCALREKGTALRFLGQFKEAIQALDEAEPIFLAMPDGAFDLAIVAYVRSVIAVRFAERAGEALTLARSAIATFREFGDAHRELSARLVEAEALEITEGYRAAAESYERVISLASRLDRQEIAAHAFNNAANEYAELREFDKAKLYYMEALARHDQFGNAVGKAYPDWGLARLLVLSGEMEAGVKSLETARGDLLKLGLREEHALATLDWAGARLALNRPDGVAAACQEIVLRYESEGATRNARLALAYVHEGLRQGTATPALILQVRNYLVQLSNNPSVAFQPAT
jgi:tetratricopeptide (TPR) repeat protein